MRSLLALVLVITSCATFGKSGDGGKSATTDCPGNPSCLTAPECTLDRERGCNTCRCSPVDPPNPGIVNSESIPPTR